MGEKVIAFPIVYLRGCPISEGRDDVGLGLHRRVREERQITGMFKRLNQWGLIIGYFHTAV